MNIEEAIKEDNIYLKDEIPYVTNDINCEQDFMNIMKDNGEKRQ